MKLTVAIEDLIIGIICGLLLIGYSERFFSLKLNKYVYVVAFMIYIVFIILDILYEFSDLTTHFGFIVLSIIHNVVDLVLSAAVVSHFSKWSIPFITEYVVPYLQGEQALFILGAFFVLGNAFWLVVYPFTY